MGNVNSIPISNDLHPIPSDIQELLGARQELSKRWDALTPLARNEWICWVTSVKKTETRREHIRRLEADISLGKKRPCCWPGCPHRKKAVKREAHS